MIIVYIACDITHVVNAALVMIITCDIMRHVVEVTLVIKVARVIDVVHIVTGSCRGCHPWRCAQGLRW